jgi:hypothetical protein
VLEPNKPDHQSKNPSIVAFHTRDSTLAGSYKQDQKIAALKSCRKYDSIGIAVSTLPKWHISVSVGNNTVEFILLFSKV